MSTKIDLINKAYARMRVSGLTVSPTPEDVELALDRLENMAEEWFSKNTCVGYNFEENPKPNSVHNVPREFWNAFSSNLACLLLADFGKPASPELLMERRGALSNLQSKTALIQQTDYPRRQPVGSGNDLKYNRYRRYYRPLSRAPISCETNTLKIGDIEDYVESYIDYLQFNEDVTSYTLEADQGLNVVSQSLSSPDINYRIEANGVGSSEKGFLRVKIVATTSIGRVVTRFVNFEVSDANL